MLAHGALSVTFEDNADEPIFEPELGETPLWSATRVTALFDADIDANTIQQLIASDCQLSENMVRWHILEDKDWQREWMTHYHPIQCTEHFWICPSWAEPPDSQATNLLLDPGLAFGTGTHPTTFMCIKWVAEQALTDKTVLDYGCGSGILGIAALLCNARCAVGVDIDPQALVATRDNVERNHLAPERFDVHLPADCPDLEADYVFANILAGPLVELAPILGEKLKIGGKLCLSGILNSQKDAIIGAYSDIITIDHVYEQDEWICVTGTKNRSDEQ